MHSMSQTTDRSLDRPKRCTFRQRASPSPPWATECSRHPGGMNRRPRGPVCTPPCLPRVAAPPGDIHRAPTNAVRHTSRSKAQRAVRRALATQASEWREAQFGRGLWGDSWESLDITATEGEWTAPGSRQESVWGPHQGERVG